MDVNGFLSTDQVGLAVAVGSGLLIGLERERRKGEGDDRSAAGLRTFTVAALLGAMAQLVSDVLASVALAGVAILAALAYARSRSKDPGLTTELSLIATALIGMLAIAHPALAAGCAAIVAGVLAARERLHRFATHWLSEQELHDGLLLAALALVLLPLLPSQPVSWLGHMSLRRVLMLVILILVMQAASHIAKRLLGARAGLALSGLLGGFVSSSATIASMAGMYHAGTVPLRLALCSAVLSMVATWVQILLMGSVVAPAAVQAIWPLLLLGGSVPLILGVLLWRQNGHGQQPAGASHAVLRLQEAVMVAALLFGGSVLVYWAQQGGVSGLLLGTGVAALADAHAPMASLMSLYAAGKLTAPLLMTGIMVALSANGVTRASIASLSGGWRFGAGVTMVLVLNLMVGWSAVWWLN
ncbi:MAG: MgtC/SapB family protein [Aquabacterium sp.]|uniref:MgtC/SapB family protein n=1 Tax=Aquabacterium sp. TaxID=1872578 RepID=UPI003BD4B4E5